MELVIMAGGLGSRFGGLKQIEPIDDYGNFIIDYSIFDAIRCGFDKVIFIIKRENYEAFKSTIGSRIEKHINVVYAFQDNSNIPSEYVIPNTRTKPFGTGHAVLCAKPFINDSFLVINADDFYGYDAFKTAAEFLKNNNSANTYALVGYKAANTMSATGSVKRGVCSLQDGFLTSIVESVIERNDDGSLTATAIDGSNTIAQVDENTIASVNIFAFKKSFLDYLEEYFYKFLESNKNNLETVEYFLPTVVDSLVNKNTVKVEVLKTSSKWFGVTYKEDKPEVVKNIKLLAQDGVYPINLWNI